jgi:hypothetical protein
MWRDLARMEAEVVDPEEEATLVYDTDRAQAIREQYMAKLRAKQALPDPAAPSHPAPAPEPAPEPAPAPEPKRESVPLPQAPVLAARPVRSAPPAVVIDEDSIALPTSSSRGWVVVVVALMITAAVAVLASR